MLIMIPGFNWNSGLYGGYNNISDGGLKMMHDLYLSDGNSTGFRQVRLLPLLPRMQCSLHQTCYASIAVTARNLAAPQAVAVARSQNGKGGVLLYSTVT